MLYSCMMHPIFLKTCLKIWEVHYHIYSNKNCPWLIAAFGRKKKSTIAAPK